MVVGADVTPTPSPSPTPTGQGNSGGSAAYLALENSLKGGSTGSRGGVSLYWSPATGAHRYSDSDPNHEGVRDYATAAANRSMAEAMGWLYNQSSSYRGKVIRDLIKGQFLTGKQGTTKQILSGWKAFLTAAYQTQVASIAAGQQPLTVLQLLDHWRNRPGESPGNLNAQGYTKAGTVTNTQSGSTSSSNTSYDITKPLAAKNLLNSATSQELGQTATAGQVKDFTGRLNQAERKNPGTSQSSGSSSSVTTATGTGGTHTNSHDSSSSTSQSGFSGADRAQQAIDYARAQPEWASFQGATTFMDALINSLSAPTSVR